MNFIVDYFKSLTIFDWVEIVLGLVGFVISMITVLKMIKNKKWKELESWFTEELKPLMEQAETFHNYSAEEKEDWVIKKLQDKLHLDLYKYKKELKLIKSIIQKYCKITKDWQINNIKVIEEKEVKKNDTTAVY